MFSPLQNGHRIKIVQPAYRIDGDVASELQRLFDPAGIVVDDVPEKPGFGKLSDTDAGRAQELVSAFADPQVGAILVGHGGYGCMRLLGRMDWDLIRRNPKPIVGFSDATALLVPISSLIGANAMHGPNAKSLVRDADDATLAALTSALTGDWLAYNALLASEFAGTHILRQGEATGRLIGGNLSLLASLCGTPHAADTNGTILFLEEWNEPHYRFDRMLEQLRLAGAFDRLSGIVLGDMLDMTRVGEDLAEDLEQRILGLAPEGIPVVSRFPVGHGVKNLCLHLGAEYSLSEASFKLAL